MSSHGRNPEQEIRSLQNELAVVKAELAAANKILNAYGKIDTIANQELMEVEQNLLEQRRISNFSEKELKLRDKALQNVLQVNKEISRIQDEEKLLQRILESMISSLRAQRGILFVVKGEHLIARIFHNMPKNELLSEYFEFCRIQIEYSRRKKKTIYKLFQEIADSENQNVSLSFVCIPLIYDGEVLGIIYLDILSDSKTFRVQDLDIADIFSSQAAISMNNTELYSKIRAQNLELMKLLNLKGQLIDQVSREIERPVKDMREDFSNLLENYPYEKEGPVFEKVKRSVKRLTKLSATVEKVVKIQDLEREVDDLFSDRVNFTELFEFILSFYEEQIKEKNLKIQIDLSAEFKSYHSNKTIMRTIFDELISNAILYNREGGTVSLIGKRWGDYLEILVQDTGNGIPEQDLPHIFEQFYRTDASPDMNDKGAGLGLYLVSKFIKYYNGDVSVQSKFGEGTTFRLTLMQN